MTEPTEPPTASIVVDASTVLAEVETGLDWIEPIDDEGFRACVDRLLVAARLVASVDVAAMTALLDDFDGLVSPEGWRGEPPFEQAAELIRSAGAFLYRRGSPRSASSPDLRALLSTIDADVEREATAAVATTAAVLLRRIREISADRPTPHPRDDDFEPQATVETPEDTPKLPRAADVDAFADTDRTDR